MRGIAGDFYNEAQAVQVQGTSGDFCNDAQAVQAQAISGDFCNDVQAGQAQSIVADFCNDMTLDVLAVPPPHGLDWRQRSKIIKDFCCALVYWHSQEPQLVHGVTEVPMPLLRPHGIGVSMSSC